MKFFLIVSKGKHRGMPIAIAVDLFTIGSGQACQLRARHPDLGDQHCVLAIRGRKVFISDMGSGKPTTVNDEPLIPGEECPLHKNDTIGVGPLAFRVTFHEKQLSQRDLEEWALRALDEDTGPKISALAEIDEAMRKGDEHHDDAAAAAAAIMGKMSAMKGVVRGRLRLMREGGVTVVRLSDVYLVEEAELHHLKKELHDNLDTNNLRVLLDLKNVRRMSSAAVGLFAELSRWLKGRGSTLAVCRLRAELSSMVDDMRNTFNLRVYDDKAKAITAKW